MGRKDYKGLSERIEEEKEWEGSIGSKIEKWTCRRWSGDSGGRNPKNWRRPVNRKEGESGDMYRNTGKIRKRIEGSTDAGQERSGNRGRVQTGLEDYENWGYVGGGSGRWIERRSETLKRWWLRSKEMYWVQSNKKERNENRRKEEEKRNIWWWEWAGSGLEAREKVAIGLGTAEIRWVEYLLRTDTDRITNTTCMYLYK